MLQGKSQAEHQRKMLFKYVVDDVLKRDKEVYAFLQTISILQQIEPAMCNALLGISDAATYLVRLERQGLFLTSYQDTSDFIYTCHPVIRDLLSGQLRDQEPERFATLHRQAAELWRANGNDEQAMYHALMIGAYDVAVSVILNATECLLQQRQRETLIRWLHMLPPTMQEQHPRLLLLQATLVLEGGQHASALPLLAKAEALVPAAADAETRVLQAMIVILRSKALFRAGEYVQAQALCQQVLLYIPEQEYELRAAATLRLGVCASLQGDFPSGIVYLQQTLRWGTNSAAG